MHSIIFFSKQHSSFFIRSQEVVPLLDMYLFRKFVKRREIFRHYMSSIYEVHCHLFTYYVTDLCNFQAIAISMSPITCFQNVQFKFLRYRICASYIFYIFYEMKFYQRLSIYFTATQARKPFFSNKLQGFILDEISTQIIFLDDPFHILSKSEIQTQPLLQILRR